MKNVVLVCAVVLAFALAADARDVEIAISTQSGWWGQGAADQEMQEIVDNVKGVSVELFPSNRQTALADWVRSHTGDGVPDLLIMCGQFPDTIYAAGNTQANNSLAELFLDDGNTIINTGDYIFYVVNGSGTNGEGGLRTMMDIPGIAMWGDDALPCVPTADGQQFTPSLVTIPSTRPFFFDQLDGDWYPELILGQTASGDRGDPVIVRNSVTGGRVGIFFQVADTLTDIRGEVISEWINNWYLKIISDPALAGKPDPENDADDVWRDVILSWTPGVFASAVNGHVVYFGESFDDVNDGIGGTTQSASSYDPGRLKFDTLYYWRVDEVNAPPDSTAYRGKVWSFTTEPTGYQIDGARIIATASSVSHPDFGPENTINGSGLNDRDGHSTDPTDMWNSGNEPAGAWIQYEFDKVYKLHQMWVWNSNQALEMWLGLGVRDVTIEYSTDGVEWTTLAGVPEFAQAPAPATGDYKHNTTVDFAGAAARYVKLTAVSAWRSVLPQYSLSEVRFFYIPLVARKPSPDSGAVDVDVNGPLRWRAGREAGTHDVYFGTDDQAVIDGTASMTTVADAEYSPLGLDLESTYYWRVDEVNDIETPTTWQGDVWSLTTQASIVVDDFESYNDIESGQPGSNLVYETWVDGYGIPTNGSTMGYAVAFEPTMEMDTAHGGRQSAPMAYSNVGAAFSEVTRSLNAQDWTAHGVQALSLWFYGDPANAPAQLYVKINGVKVPYDGGAGNLAIASWQVWSIDLASVATNMQNVTSLTIGVEGLGATGTIVLDDVALYRLAPAPVSEWRIVNDADDVEEYTSDGTMEDSTSSDLEMPYENTGRVDPQMVGLRFTGITVPQGATITEAWVRFQVDETKGGTEAVNLIIAGELSPNAPAFTSGAGNVSGRPRTAAQVQWSVPNWTTVGDSGPDQTTPSLVSIIQEIVNQPGWSGGVIVLTFRDNPANPSLGIRCAVAGPGNDSAVLHISYE